MWNLTKGECIKSIDTGSWINCMLLLDGGKIAVGHGSGGPKSNSVSVCHLYFLVATRGNSIVGQGAKGIDGAVALKCFHTFPCVQVPHLTNFIFSSLFTSLP